MGAIRRTVQACVNCGVALLMLVLIVGMSGCGVPNAFLREQGITALDKNQIDDADRSFTKAIKNDDTDWKATYYLGVVRLRENRPLDAQILLEKSLSLRPNREETPMIYDALAESLFQQNRVANLQTVLKEACDRYGTSYDYLRQAEYLGKVGDVDGAKVAFKKAARFAETNDASPYFAMVKFFESLHDSENAVMALRYAYYIQPQSPKLAAKFRQYGIVPGPTVALRPDRDDLKFKDEQEAGK